MAYSSDLELCSVGSHLGSLWSYLQSISQHPLGMDKLTSCVSEVLNGHDWWLVDADATAFHLGKVGIIFLLLNILFVKNVIRVHILCEWLIFIATLFTPWAWCLW